MSESAAERERPLRSPIPTAPHRIVSAPHCTERSACAACAACVCAWRGGARRLGRNAGRGCGRWLRSLS
eukprot:6176144-Pleurochrysis_carterae.AAC.2